MAAVGSESSAGWLEVDPGKPCGRRRKHVFTDARGLITNRRKVGWNWWITVPVQTPMHCGPSYDHPQSLGLILNSANMQENKWEAVDPPSSSRFATPTHQGNENSLVTKYLVCSHIVSKVLSNSSTVCLS